MTFLETLETHLAMITEAQEDNRVVGDDLANKVRQTRANRERAYSDLKTIRRSGFILQQQKVGLMELIALEKKRMLL